MIGAERALLERIAREEMLARGFLTDMPRAALSQAEALDQVDLARDGARDLRDLPWTSIDNPESRDLDQIEVLEQVDGGTRLYVGIADVTQAVPEGSPVDAYAANNTTSVYTGIHTYTMLPTQLAYNLTSLLPERDRRVTVVEMLIGKDGQLGSSKVYPALALNHAKLNYPSVSRWLDGGPPPPELRDDERLRLQLELQDDLAQKLAGARHTAGSIAFETAKTEPVLSEEGEIVGLEHHVQDRAGAIIEEFMIAANRSFVQTLDEAHLPSILRVVRVPERWPNIVQYAAEHGFELPQEPDSSALSRFVDRMRHDHAEEFHEISLSLIKLIGRGEYVAHRPGQKPVGHFGLAIEQYSHATAPNRRFADLAMQRLVGPLAGRGHSPYTFGDLERIAERCTIMEAEAERVERRVRKSIAAALLSHRIGDRFQGVITKAEPDNVFVHVFHPPVEGKIIRGARHVRVGDKVRVRLVSVDIERSYIDFVL